MHQLFRIALRTVAVGTVAAALGVLTVGCAGTPPVVRPAAAASSEVPAWYLNPAAVYPDEIYLTAVGTGDTRRAAEQQAMAGLSQIFEADIQVDMTTRERYADIVTAQGSFSESEVELAQTTNVQSAQRLLNVQTGEAAVDESGRVHVIAYIERIPTGRLYLDLIEKNGAQVGYFLDEADNSPDLIRAYAYESAAAVVAAGNELLRYQLRIIAPAMERIVQLPYDYNNVLRRRADAASRMRVAVNIGNDEGGRVAGVVRQALGEERFPVDGSNPVLRVGGRVSVEPVELSADFETVRWVLTLDVSGPEGVSILTYDDQGRASAVTVESARSFAYRDIQDAVEKNFIVMLRRYFDSVVLGE